MPRCLFHGLCGFAEAGLKNGAPFKTFLGLRRRYVSATERSRLREPPRQLRHSGSPASTSLVPKTVPKTTFRHRAIERAKLLKTSKTLFGPDGKPILASITLRDACQCRLCVDPSTKQRNFSFADIPVDVNAIQDETIQYDELAVRWENDIPGFTDHLSTYTLNEVTNLAMSKSATYKPVPELATSWSTKSIQDRLVKVPYDDYMTDNEKLFGALRGLLRDGLIFVTSVPSSPESVSNLVERIGPLRNSFYGSTWDVRSKPQADNVAYTNKDLGFHMDLLYMSEPPSFQFLHCIQNTCVGGESRFVDTRYARNIMEVDHADHVQPLHEHRVMYKYDNFGQLYTKNRSVFDKGHRVYWSPPFVGRLSKSIGGLRAFVAACKIFAEILERPDLVYETKMEEGTCAIFQNTRVAHARNTFDVNSGQRWLRGAYLDLQPFLSKYIHLDQQLVKDTPDAAA